MDRSTGSSILTHSTTSASRGSGSYSTAPFTPTAADPKGRITEQIEREGEAQNVLLFVEVSDCVSSSYRGATLPSLPLLGRSDNTCISF